MPEVSRFYGIIITFYYMDHRPPHFHARYNEKRAAISIADLSIMEGRLPPRVAAMVREWAQTHRAELLANWELAEAREPLREIEPLE